MQGLQAGEKYSISSGTGFFVSKNKIVTSNHVVQDCINIAIRGSVPPTLVQLSASYEQYDLALLDSPIQPPKLPFLRTNSNTISSGDVVNSIGYPLERGDTGMYILKPANVVSIKLINDSPYYEIFFTDSVDHGNSGSPLLDSNSNIIGVVTSKVTFTDPYTDLKVTQGVALGMDSLFSFLDKNNVDYQENNTFNMVQDFRSDLRARDYIVNVHCIKKVDE